MTPEKSARRDFLRVAGAGIAGGAVQIHPAAAQTTPTIPGGAIHDVRLFGATGDGKSIDTPAVNRAIEAANKAAGGGTVRFPAGSYLCYSIRLKSNVALYLDQNAAIIAADPPILRVREGTTLAEPNTPWNDYQDYGHNHWHNSLLWGEGLENVSIFGPGLIWGRGLSRGYGTGPRRPKQPGVGNKAISLKNCRNVILRDFSILKGGHFGILATGVDNFTVDNLKIDTDRDGIDIDCCRNVRVSNCTVNSPWDDAICPKSSFALGYARATENVTITNCYVTANYQLGTLLDGTFKPHDSAYKGDTDRPHQVRHRVERRIQEHHHFQLRLRRLPGPGARNRRRRTARRHHHHQHHDARHQLRARSSFVSGHACAVRTECRWELCAECSSATSCAPIRTRASGRSSAAFPGMRSKTSRSATFTSSTREAQPAKLRPFSRRSWRTRTQNRICSARCPRKDSSFAT